MQTSYDQSASAGVAGQLVDAGSQLASGAIRSARGPSVQGIEVSVDSVANATLYRITVNRTSQASATYGQTLSTNCDYTSDGSATEAEILAGLLAAVNAASQPTTAVLTDATNGPLLLTADQKALEFTLTLSANLSQADASGEIPFGVAVCFDSDEKEVRLPMVAGDIGNKTLGVALRSLAQENNLDGTNVYPLNADISVVRKGRVWVTVEEAVSAGDDAWVRYATNGAADQKGAFRKSGDGVAQVTTLTPTAANAAPYSVGVGAYSYGYLSDGTATAAEIVADLLAQINLQTSLHGVTASGTNTLVLTGIEGVAFDVSQSANIAAAATTAVTATAKALAGAKFMSAASADGLAILELDL